MFVKIFKSLKIVYFMRLSNGRQVAINRKCWNEKVDPSRPIYDRWDDILKLNCKYRCYNTFNPQWRDDLVIALCGSLILFFEPNTPGLKQPEIVLNGQSMYKSLLNRLQLSHFYYLFLGISMHASRLSQTPTSIKCF